jgi:hypothetical protein
MDWNDDVNQQLIETLIGILASKGITSEDSR